MIDNVATLPANKTCSKCGNDYPRTIEYFKPYAGRSIDGLRPVCVICVRAYDVQRKRKKATASK